MKIVYCILFILITYSNAEYPLDCSVDGLFCIDDGEHNYQYLECSSNYKGFRQCAPGTKCAGQQNNPYTYNPCVSYTNVTSEPVESNTTQSQTSDVPITPSVGEKSSEHHQSNVPLDCSVDGLFCIDDGEHDYQYLECSSDYKGFRQCAPGTKCAGQENNPYTYNPCVSYTNTTDSNVTSEPVESNTTQSQTSDIPITPSVGNNSSEPQQPGSSVPLDCSVDGLFCIDDGEHDYQYLECSSNYKGFRQCAPGTKCAGQQNNPYTYNPCVSYTNGTSEQVESNTTQPQTSDVPITPSVGDKSSEPQQPGSSVPLDCSVDGLFCVDDGEHDYQYLECSSNYKGFRQCAPGTKCAGQQNNPYTYNPCVYDPFAPRPQSSDIPITPSVGDKSSEPQQTGSTIPTDCSVDGFFCVDDGLHDYQYLECSSNYKGFRQCAPGTKCAGQENNPYTYNPCIYDPFAPRPETSDVPITPSVGDKSSEPQQPGSTIPLDCSVDGLFCVDDGLHNYQYLECSSNYKGFRQCAPGTKCAGQQNNPYTYNPCVYDPFAPRPETSDVPITPSVGDKSSEPQQPGSSVPTDCSVDGFFCVDDGLHDYQYLECSSNYKGFRQCAPGTKCSGQQNNPYTYNPCVSYTNVTSESNTTEQRSSEQPITPSVGEKSSEHHQSNVPLDCSVEGLFCVMDGLHDYQYLECSSNYKGFRQCAPGTKCAGYQDEPYKFNPCVIYNSTEFSSEYHPDQSSQVPITPSVGDKSSEQPQSQSTNPNPIEEDIQTCGDFECPEDGIYCVIDNQRNNRYCECASTFKGSRPCAPGTWCQGEQSTPYDYNPCVFIDQTSWFGNEIHDLPKK